jgi:hypothetical protein
VFLTRPLSPGLTTATMLVPVAAEGDDAVASFSLDYSWRLWHTFRSVLITCEYVCHTKSLISSASCCWSLPFAAVMDAS